MILPFHRNYRRKELDYNVFSCRRRRLAIYPIRALSLCRVNSNRTTVGDRSASKCGQIKQTKAQGWQRRRDIKKKEKEKERKNKVVAGKSRKIIGRWSQSLREAKRQRGGAEAKARDGATVDQNCVKMRRLILHFTTCSDASEWP